MYKQRISYADYVEEVERLYKIERRDLFWFCNPRFYTIDPYRK